MKGLNKKISLLNLKKVTSFCPLLIAYCLLAFTNSTYPTIRYVSHEGSNTPPYTSWETAADSIMSAINISVFGDTIYVANGVYEEQVVMIPGLTLIGSGMDSTIIDTRSMAFAGFNSVIIKDSCVFKSFQVIVANQDVGNGISCEGINGIVRNDKIKDGVNGIRAIEESGYEIKDNICENNRIGIRLTESSSIVENNIIYSNYFQNTGIHITDYNNTAKPIIRLNLIITNSRAIKIVFSNVVTITNNTFILDDDFARGYSGGYSDTVKLYNNLVITNKILQHAEGFLNTGVPHLTYNNLVFGRLNIGFSFTGSNSFLIKLINNSVIGSTYGISNNGGNSGVTAHYNNAWGIIEGFVGFNVDTTNTISDPMSVNEDTTQGELDFHLQKFSPLIDAGDPDILDVDGSRSDIGLYGGPFGERYQYIDLAPKPPRNLTATVDSQYINLSWNSNTEADFNSYNLFRDTTANFTVDSTTFVLSLKDTFYVQIIPPGIDEFYYKLTATDNQGNESQPSEELAVIITSINEYPTTVSNYRLYQNYPNPFNPSTKIGYKLKERGYVKLYVYDIKGELVTVLVNHFQEAGYYEVEFFGEVGSGQSEVSNQLSSGVYIYQIIVKNENNIPVFTDMKKMIFLK